MLHKLVHTKLLSGSLNSELELTPAQRRKALSGRVVELTGDVKLGRGERSVRLAEHNKASKRVREGLMQKQKERRAAQLQEVCFFHDLSTSGIEKALHSLIIDEESGKLSPDTQKVVGPRFRDGKTQEASARTTNGYRELQRRDTKAQP